VKHSSGYAPGDTDGDNITCEATLEAFGVGGVSLGTVEVGNTSRICHLPIGGARATRGVPPPPMLFAPLLSTM
jgi:hypothetical protein